MILPNFIIAGAPKSGTTTLYDILIQHPDVGMSFIKEPNFFSDGWPNVVKTLDEYSNLFRHCYGKKVIGEASPFYFFDEKSPERIRQTLGTDTKIVMILRNPADRAYSHWAHEKYKYFREPLAFADALQQENERADADEVRRLKFYYPGLYRYYWGGLYFEKVSRYLDAFGANNVIVLIYEDFVKSPVEVSQKMFHFLGIDSAFVPIIPKSNPASQSSLPGLTKLISTIHQSDLFASSFALLPVPAKRFLYKAGEELFRVIQFSKDSQSNSIAPDLRALLVKSYLPDIRLLENLLGLDLSIWYDGINYVES